MNSAPPLFTLRRPQGPAVPIVVNIPHAGTYVPEHIASTFASDAIRALPMTDWHLPELYDFLPSMGVTTLFANVSRMVADLNRPPDAKPLYPGRFETGLVALKTFQGEAIFSEPPDTDEVERRRRQYHQPYHEKLNGLLEQLRKHFGSVVLIDAHSVASGPSLLHDALSEDIYLGNRDGASCGSWLIDDVGHSFTEAGLKVARNAPYKGGYITAHYGRPPAVHALQIEMCQRIYMNEGRPQPLDRGSAFLHTREIVAQAVGVVCAKLGAA